MLGMAEETKTPVVAGAWWVQFFCSISLLCILLLSLFVLVFCFSLVATMVVSIMGDPVHLLAI